MEMGRRSGCIYILFQQRIDGDFGSDFDFPLLFIAWRTARHMDIGDKGFGPLHFPSLV